jgi:hypothetical protein
MAFYTKHWILSEHINGKPTKLFIVFFIYNKIPPKKAKQKNVDGSATQSAIK